MQRIIKYTQTVIFYNIRAEKNQIKINNNKKYWACQVVKDEIWSGFIMGYPKGYFWHLFIP